VADTPNDTPVMNVLSNMGIGAWLGACAYVVISDPAGVTGLIAAVLGGAMYGLWRSGARR